MTCFSFTFYVQLKPWFDILLSFGVFGFGII